MENKDYLIKYVKSCFYIGIILTFLWSLIGFLEYKYYIKNSNELINNMVISIKQNYPDIKNQEIARLLNVKMDEQEEVLSSYGIDIEKQSAVLKNDNASKWFMLGNALFFAGALFLFFWIYLQHNKKKDEEIREISKYVTQINRGNYELKIDNNTEDELSILKNEVYKSTIMLKEGAEKSLEDKVKLKDSLSDISHQLKTPLTSILISLENLEDEPDMELDTRLNFIKMAKHDANNINFLVQALLKLSKFDANTIEFNRKKDSIKSILREAVNNVDSLCDLKNITIDLNDIPETELLCDRHWQIEALTNLIKNGVEHAAEKVEISCEVNSIYIGISIKNDGEYISQEDLPHIFERFYRGENAAEDSVGIGLALAKSIIEKEGGYLSVDSMPGETEFIIKYLLA